MADQVKYNKLHGKKILIVGGSSGLGYAVAEASLESGATVIISSSNPDRVATAVSRLQTAYPSAKARITGHACDLSQETTLESNLTALLNKTTSYGSAPLDHAIHTAGDALALVKLADVDFPAIKKAGMLRFFAPMLLAKHLPAHIHPGPGSSFTLTTGVVSERPLQGWTVVGSYATGVQGLGRQLALDLKPLRVNVVSSGPVDTELWDGMSAQAKREMMESFEAGMATGKVGAPEDVAEAYLYCMRDGNVTGSLISTNGGKLVM